MSVIRLIGLLLVVGWVGVALGSGTRVPGVSCSSVFIEALGEYRTVCSNGTYYTTRYRPAFRQWEIDQTFPSGPRKPLPLHRQPRPGAQQR